MRPDDRCCTASLPYACSCCTWHGPCSVLVPALVALAAGVDVAAAVAVFSATIVGVRAYDATKGPLPIELMMPVPTPAGDASSIGIWLWQSDALLWTAALSFGALAAMSAGPPTLLWSIPILIVLAALTVGRLRRAAT